MTMMKAAVVSAPGGPDVLKLEHRPLPVPEKGWVRIAVKAFGINRSEMFTRQGHSPSVTFPRILGIEAVGVIDEAPGGEFQRGEIVATVMGGMGRQYDGGYAEYTRVPARQVRRVETKLPWSTLGALPEMLQTAWGVLFSGLRLQKTDRLLIRGGTTSVGMAAISIAKAWGAHVSATTRRKERAPALWECGSDRVIVDDGKISAGAYRFDKVLELVGTTALEDSLLCADRGGLVCMSGMVGNKWAIDHFAPMDSIPNRVSLTTYSGEPTDFLEMPFQELVDDVAAGRLTIRVGRVFQFDQIVEAHQCMEDNAAEGKIVVVI
ncbi:zinc-binding alcohol dehydrogenase family protein [Rhizobium sp. BK060]|uniref:zinc-binding alcohol dehydrogenase family protein n=1 Tax=Rhizobium sp. BK060 TaxID=2587096 RepID=UPI001849EAF4|nr:zinc-binding alcohol dehydrogenase family protein [Rhizobium sp. BK060]MBB3398786.1 NADPH:quinone reductase-like Zn-dependent oxidoreductase [Rhizobium sp. BK060]